MLRRSSLLFALLLVSGPASGETWEFSPEVAAYVESRVGEAVSCLCPRFSELQPAATGRCSCSASGGSLHTYTIAFRIEDDRSVTIDSIERGPDSPPVWRSIRRSAEFVNAYVWWIVAAAWAIAFAAFWKAFLLWDRSFVTPALPIVPRQTIPLTRPGTHVMYVVRAGLTTQLPAHTRTGLWDPVTQQYVVTRPARSSPRQLGGRAAWQAFDVPRAGEYHLVIDGLDGVYEDRLQFSLAETGKIFLLALVAAACAIAALPLTILAASGTRL